MKKVCLTLVFVSIACCSFAQWTTSGTNIYNSNTGNVGIGTTSPQTKLHVVGGEIRLAGQGTSGPASGAFISFYDSNNTTRYGYLGDASAGNTDIYLNTAVGSALHFGTNGSGDQVFIGTSGNVGIGTGNPAVRLSVTPSTAAGLNSGLSSSAPVVNIASTGGFSGIMVLEGNNNNAAGVVTLRNNRSLNFAYNISSNVNDFLGALTFEGFSTTTGVSRLGAYITSNVESVQSTSLSGNLKFYTTDATGTTAPRLYIASAGNVGINTTDTKGYQFAVNGTAIATAMTVKLYANWPDYVFKKDYQLPSLLEVKSYIDQNQHLPDMPSEAEVTKNGINLGEINTLLTKKVEELTLYLIDQQKIQKQQQEEIDQLKATMKQLLKTAKQ